MPPTVRYGATDWQEPLKLGNMLPDKDQFIPTQVITPPGYYNQGSLAGDILNNFTNITEQMQQRRQQQMQMQNMAQAVQQFAPQLEGMGYTPQQINSLFKVDPKSLLKSGEEEMTFGSHQRQEIEKARKLHEQEVEMNKLSIDQLDAVDDYKNGKIGWNQLNQLIPYDKLDKAMELSKRGMDLQKASALIPIEQDEKIQDLLKKTLENKALPIELHQKLTKSALEIKKLEHDVAIAPTKDALEQAKQALAERKQQVYEQLNNYKNPGYQTGSKPIKVILKNGLTQENTKIYNSIAALNDGSMTAAQNMYRAARKAGINIPAPDAMTDPKQFIKSVKYLLENKSMDDSQKAQGQQSGFQDLLQTAGGNPPTSTGKYDSIVNQAAQQYGISPLLIKAVMRQESGGNPNARSGVGAQGLMQLMPETARALGVHNLNDPQQNILGGAKYLAQLNQQFGGDVKKVLAAYNAGPAAVQKYGGVPPFKETQNYVKNITQNLQQMGQKAQPQQGATILGHKLSSDEYAKYQSYDDDKKRRFILFLQNQGR